MSDIVNTKSDRIIPIDIETEMKKSFIDYAMSVIVDRALPDVRDGLKPVHRRILYAMYGLGFTPDKAHRKCATTVGEVLGKFHPHGDTAVYESLVRMAQKFSLRYTLIDGHGNFGSVDGDSAAAMRYTEARLSKLAMEMLSDINKDVVNFKPNFDEHLEEPVVLPSRFPNLLVNGSTGIAVGMATNIPPHNLGEVIDGVIAIIDNPEMTIDELCEIVKGPDFPTEGIIIGRSGIIDAYKTGRGRIIVRGRAVIEQVTGSKQRIIVTELPYQVNKARLMEKIVELVKDKRIDGISDLRDESDRDGMRMVIEVKRDANANVLLNQLYKNTQMQEAFNANMLALVTTPAGKFEPKTLNLKQLIEYYIAHQKEIIVRRTTFELKKAEARAHILEGLRIALRHLDEVIAIIRGSKTENLAKQNLKDRFELSDEQSQAIVDMRLGRLTGLEIERLEEEYRQLLEKIDYYRRVLANDTMIFDIVKQELLVIRDRFADQRLTEIVPDEKEFSVGDLIEEQQTVITLTHFGYIKRIPMSTYRSQRRGGKGIIGISTREEDFVENLFITSTHDFLLFFTSKGKLYRLKAYEVPESGRQAKGTAIVNILQLGADEKVNAVIPISEYSPGMFLMMCTKNGIIKKTDLMEYNNVRKGGLVAVSLKENDELIDVMLTDQTKEILITTSKGMVIRFNETDARPLGRSAQGVIGIRLSEEDNVVGMSAIISNTNLLVVTENGFGKRMSVDEFTVQLRGGKGLSAYKVTSKTGRITGAKLVSEDDDIIMISSDGTIIRMKVDEIRRLSRQARGVTLMRLQENISVVSIARIINEEDTNFED